MKEVFGAKPGDLILILSGDDVMKARKQLCELRLKWLLNWDCVIRISLFAFG